MLLGSESRLIYSMARDGLIPAGFSKVGENGVPKKAVMCVWAAGILLAGFVPIDSIAELCNIGTLWAFFMISLTVIVLRKSQPDLERSFKVPLVQIIPVISMALCAFLASQLDIVTWIVFIIWTCAGMVIYFLYGRKHSNMGISLSKENKN